MKHVALIAAGKAAPAMAAAAAKRLGSLSGLVAGAELARPVVAPTPEAPPTPEATPTSWAEQPPLPSGCEFIVGGHPTPNARSEEGGRKALAIAESLSEDDTLLVLISGGASALMAVPADGVTLDDKRATTDRLLRAGADIYALNTVRKHLSAIKGGWLAARTRAACIALAISDVVGDDLSVIASGPTVADASTFQDALDILRRFGGEHAYPAGVMSRLHAGVHGSIAETPKPGDARVANARTRLIGSRRDAMRGAADQAIALGYQVISIDDAVTGEARTASASHLGAALARAAGIARPACIVSSGETTVNVTGSGKAVAIRSLRLRRRSRSPKPPPQPWWRASALTVSTGPRTPPAPSSTRQRLVARRPPDSTRSGFFRTTMPTRFSTRSAISSGQVRPAPTSATFR